MPPAATPRYANNLGILGDRNGWLTGRSFLVLAAGDDLAADEDCDVPPGTTPLTRLEVCLGDGRSMCPDQLRRGNPTNRAGGVEARGHPGERLCQAGAAPGLVPLRRFLYPATGDHVLTALATENDLAGRGYREEGIEGYVFSDLVAGSMPLYRTYNLRTHQHRYTTAGSSISPLLRSGRGMGSSGTWSPPRKSPTGDCGAFIGPKSTCVKTAGRGPSTTVMACCIHPSPHEPPFRPDIRRFWSQSRSEGLARFAHPHSGRRLVRHYH